MNRFALAALATVLLCACTGSAPPSVPPTANPTHIPTKTPTASPTPSPSHSPIASAAPSPSSTRGELLPICNEPNLSSPGDGQPHPDGRIIFGRLVREDRVKGQIVSLFAVDPDGSDQVELLNCEIARPRFSPDGSRIAFGIVLEDQSLQVATIASDGTDLRILTDTPGYAETPDWSPDGSWLIYSHAPEACSNFDSCVVNGNLWTLWRMNADGSDQRQIGNSDTFDWEPRISPDGMEVVFQRLEVGGDWAMSLWTRDLATGAERPVSNDHRPLEHPDWSTDGRSIIYNPTGCGPCEQIELMPADDVSAEPIVLYPGDESHSGFKPVYSPDGSHIAFGCKLGLCVMDADGSNFRVVVEWSGGPEINHFDWTGT